MKHFIIVAISILFCFADVCAQRIQFGTPFSKRSKLPNIQAVSVLEKQNNQRLATALSGSDDFAVPIHANYTPDNSGQWDFVDNQKVWRLALYSPSAYSLNLIFSNFCIPCGAELYMYGADTSQAAYSFNSDNNTEWLPTVPVSGDVVIVEYKEPCDADFPGSFEIVQVGHDFRGVFASKKPEYLSDCQIDVNSEMASDWQNEKRSVCKIVINGTTLCSGVLLNTSDASFSPYVLTARHCISTEKQAQNSIFYFNYESPDSIDNQYVVGANLIALKDNDDGYLDFSLLKLKSAVPAEYNAYYAGWDCSGELPFAAACIHHPNGDVKKISFVNDTLSQASYRLFDSNSFWRVDEWQFGATEIGSSGAPLFNSEHNVIGILSGGDSDCSFPMNDFFQKFSVCYDGYQYDSLQLKHWLNPNGDNITKLAGNFGVPMNANDKSAEHNFDIYPNPFSSYISLSVDNDFITEVQLFDLTGRKFLAKKFAEIHTAALAIDDLPRGSYVCKIILKGGGVLDKLIIKQ